MWKLGFQVSDVQRLNEEKDHVPEPHPLPDIHWVKQLRYAYYWYAWTQIVENI